MLGTDNIFPIKGVCKTGEWTFQVKFGPVVVSIGTFGFDSGSFHTIRKHW